MHPDAARLQARLDLRPHPEGGWFRETYRANLQLPAAALPPGYGTPRAAATSIFYLLVDGVVSRLHRLRGDELWLHQAGPGLVLHLLHTGGHHERLPLGPGPDRFLQAVTPAGTWFGAEVADPGGWALVACVMAPGFDPADWELADRQDVLAAWPAHADLIARLTAPR